MRIASPSIRPASPAGPLAALAALSLMMLAMLALAPPAMADVGQTIVNRCLHGKSLSGFTQRDYQRALQELGTEVEEYSNCASLIHAAQLAKAGGGGSARSTVATPVSPAEQSSINRVSKLGSGPLRIGGGTISPGVVHANVASALNSLPSSLLAVVAFLLGCALLSAGGALRSVVRRRNQD
jgi:hypothetical protein